MGDDLSFYYFVENIKFILFLNGKFYLMMIGKFPLNYFLARKIFIVFYVVIGTLSHAKIILELLLPNDKAKHPTSQKGETPSTPHP